MFHFDHAKLWQLVQEELEGANQDHPKFASPHEGYAVILEEVEEACCELKAVQNWADCLWRSIKLDRGSTDYIRKCESITDYAARVASETIQIAAMAQKFIDSMK